MDCPRPRSLPFPNAALAGAILLAAAWSFVLGPSASPLAAQTSAVTVATITDTIRASGDVSVGPDGAVYAADFGRALNVAGGTEVHRVAPTGEVSSFATGFGGASGNDYGADGFLYQSDVGRGEAWRLAADGTRELLANGLSSPVGVTPGPEGVVYVAECGAHAIRRIDPDGSSARIIAGAPLNCPNGLTIGPDGNLYTVNFSDSKMVRITLPAGEASVFAEIPGGGNGHVTAGNGRFYVASFRGRKIYDVTTGGVVRALAGTGEAGNDDGPGDRATFFRPNGVSLTPDGDTLYVNTTTRLVPPASLDLHPNVVRMITGIRATLDAP